MSAPEQGPPDAVHRLRVRYCETDRMGVTHHGSYIDWFEEARTEWLRDRGQSYREMSEELGVREGTLRVRVLRCRRLATEARDEACNETPVRKPE